MHYIGMVMDYKMGTTHRSNPSMLDAIMWESQGKISIQNIHLGYLIPQVKAAVSQIFTELWLKILFHQLF